MTWPELAPFEGPIVVACSGGADSSCLAHMVAARARAEGRAMPVLAHVDHGLRPESAAEAQQVRELASRLGASAVVLPVEVPAGSSLEARAREARYAALDALVDERCIRWVLLAHTASDQVETILMRLFRGTGVRGLAGMPAQRGHYARPLLHWTRAQTEAYCREHALDVVEDPMNRDPRFTRSRLRHHWLPELREENPRIGDALLRLAEEARAVDELLDWALEERLNGRVGDAIELDGPWQSLPRLVRRRLLQLSAEAGGVGPLEQEHLDRVEALCTSGEGSQSLDLPGGRARRAYRELRFVSRMEESITVSWEPVECEPGYVLRLWEEGERMRPARLKGHSKKLSRLYSDLKVPREERWRRRVLVEMSTGQILWAEGIGLAHDVELDERLTDRLRELIK